MDLVVLSTTLQDHFDLRYFDLIKDRSLLLSLHRVVEDAGILISLVIAVVNLQKSADAVSPILNSKMVDAS